MGKKRFCMPDPSAAVTDELLKEHIGEGSRVIDLGCGDGRLLCRLRDELGCSVQGVELDIDELFAGVARGIPIIRADLDQRLGGIPDGTFDFAVLSQTLQQVRNTSVVVTEMLRIAHCALVVVPNFGHWKIRRQILFTGRAPVTETLPYEWHDSPNLHFMSMHDFRDLSIALDFEIVREFAIINGKPRSGKTFAANLRAESLFYVLENKSH
jgi:methionine biosynthesis protein MetW